MATTVVMNTLTRQGEPDPDDRYSFEVDKNTYKHLKPYPKRELDTTQVLKTRFFETYRRYNDDPIRNHLALELESKVVEINNDDRWDITFSCLCVVWIEPEERWVVFDYREVDDIAESYGSTVQTAFPSRGPVYRINNDIAKLIKHQFGMTVPLRDVYKTAPLIEQESN